MLSRFGLLMNTVVKIRRKEKVIVKNVPHNAKMTFDPKMPTIFFLQNLRILDRFAFAHCKISIRRSTATSYEKNFDNSFNLKSPLFF